MSDTLLHCTNTNSSFFPLVFVVLGIEPKASYKQIICALPFSNISVQLYEHTYFGGGKGRSWITPRYAQSLILTLQRD